MNEHKVEKRKSNQEIAADNLGKLRDWLGKAEELPARGSNANISAIALGAGVDRQALYRDEAREMIKLAVQEKGLEMPNQQRAGAGDVPAWATQRIHELEQQLAVAKVENSDLRRRLRRYDALDRHLSETGMLPR